MLSIQLVLLLFAAICFLIGFIGYPPTNRNVVALGLLFWVLTQIIR